MILRYSGIRVTNLEQSLKRLRQGKMSHGGEWVLLEDPRSHQRLELNWYPADSAFATEYVPGEG